MQSIFDNYIKPSLSTVIVVAVVIAVVFRFNPFGIKKILTGS